MKFIDFLTEEKTVEKLSHLEHVEDHVLDDAHEGYHRSVGSLQAVFSKMSGVPDAASTKLTAKYDGSPSIVFGYHPENDRFFVGTKSVFSKNPKMNFTDEDINKNHEDPGLRSKLKTALEHLPKISPPSGIYQGDLMYRKGDVFEDNTKYHFTPNVIQYTVKKADPEGAKVRKAEMGIAVHTKYHGKDFDSMRAGFDVDRHMFKTHPDVHTINPEVKFDKLIRDKDVEAEFKTHMLKADDQYNNLHQDTFDATSAHAVQLKKYIHQTVRSDEKPTAVGFKAYMVDQNDKETEKLKTAAGKLKRKDSLISNLSYVDTHHDKYQHLFNIHHHLTKAKEVLVNALGKSTPFEHSIEGEETKPEGYVVVYKGYPSKLVDRTQFSKANFKKAAADKA